MPLQAIDELMENARRGSYAVGYFESWNLESLQGVIDAGEATRSPLIIGFNGEFLSQRRGAVAEDLMTYAAMGMAEATRAKVPCGFIFNECPDDNWVEVAIGAGFNLVMPADPAAKPDDYKRRVARLAVQAHARGVAIEAEVDKLPCGDHDGTESDPRELAAFVAATNVNLLAVSVGNEHIKLEGRASLDLVRLEAIHEAIGIPLVLHGGSGIEDDSLKAAVRLGVGKVNYGTYIKQRYLQTIRRTLTTEERNPHALLGNGGDTDLMVIGRTTVRNAVLERIEALGCCGKA